uniref:Probable ATP-dependent RNA helicase spindle-E n=2 Tax=Drosophila ananassae TaxID=7217 RepID=SPNE_DROAN|nr:RecName: Full=Probable ATP-dependent RNA helicase spindle-E; AltName: Full=Homeless [Drosophila ananassae]
MDFFDFTKDFRREEAPSGFISSDPSSMATEMFESKPIKREVIGTDYVAEIAAKEKLLMSGQLKAEIPGQYSGGMDDLDSNDDMDDEEISKIRLDEEYYKKYRFNLNRDKNLPIYAKREVIVNAINTHQVVILKGETGCGKTTQVPQYILDEGFKSGQYCNIVVTQPRRIGAISIANRVSQERMWEPDTVCSYQVGLHRKQHLEDTRLLYCTTGVLLNSLIRNKTLTHYTHIVLDEVHERDQDMDFLLIVVRRLLATNSRHVKVILMSATIDTREFCDYFSTKVSVPPVISASHGRKHSIEKFYRDQLGSINWKDDPDDGYQARIPDEAYKAAVKIILVVDNMERQAANQSEQSYDDAKSQGAVLIFLPGIYEIDNMAESLGNMTKEEPSMKLFIVRCFSLMTPDAQRDVFSPPPSGFRKIILATNIAESSITVPDVSYVIDFCLTKVLVTDTATNFSSLRLTWASKANCRQRAGRVGRLRSGRVYRMVHKLFYKTNMTEFGVPEMLRLPLQNSVLKAKLLDIAPPIEMLALALSPPNLSDIQNTILLLKEVGALFPTVDGEYCEVDGDITFWGIIMSRLPLDTRLSRLIILGYVFNLLEEAIVIAAGLSMRGLSTEAGRGRLTSDAYWMNYVFADGSGSDLVAIWRIYRTYENMVANGMHQESAEPWARRYHVSLRALKEMHLLVQELKSRCSQLGMISFNLSSSDMPDDLEKAILLKVIIAGAFYPNYFLRSKKTTLEQERDIFHVISGRDPCRTVYFTNFKPAYMGELYTRRIKDLFQELKIPPESIEVTFQPGSQKVFVTFKSDECDTNCTRLINVPGQVLTEVYKSIRMRLYQSNRTFRVMDHNNALNYVQRHGIGTLKEGHWTPPSRPLNVEMLALPSVYEKNMTGLITHVDHCGKFFFQPKSFARCIQNMSEIINTPMHLQYEIQNAGVLTKGMMVLAKRKGTFERAIIVRPETQNNRQPKFFVRFVDYGNTDLMYIEQLRLMTKELLSQYGDLPPRVFECRLALVQPSTMSNTLSRWSRDAKDMLISASKNNIVEIEIYSLVYNVAAVMVHTRDGLLNDKLVEHNLARRADENFMSRQDHDFRIRKQESARYISGPERQQVNEEYLRSCQMPEDLDLTPPPLDKCNMIVMLKGPYSPLETSMFSTIRVGVWKTVKIDNSSVNAVLLDSDPQDNHDQLVVSHSTVESSNGDVLTARGTTLMPNIHGFGPLMTMLFCPTMQIKCNKDCTKYVSILAGLGFDKETMKPYFEEHDMVMNLDVNLYEDDVRMINQMRYNIDTMFFNFEGEELPSLNMNDRVTIYKELRKLVNRLLSKDRSYIELNASNSDFNWEKEDRIEPQPEPFGKRCIFPMHVIPELLEEDIGRRLYLIDNCKKLYKWRNFEGALDILNCKLCNMSLETTPQLRLHLLTQLHRDREKQIGFKNE